MKTNQFSLLVLLSLLVAQTAIGQNFLQHNDYILSGVETEDLWKDINDSDMQSVDISKHYIQPNSYRLVEIDNAIMAEVVEHTKQFPRDDDRKVITMMFMPMPDGDFETFAIFADPIMHPLLAEKYPEIKTYKGVSVENPSRTIRLDNTPQGTHAQIRDPKGAIYIDPYSLGDDRYYMSYRKSDLTPPTEPVLMEEALMNDLEPASTNGGVTNSGDELRTYRLALACTFEYAQFHGGTLSSVMSAFVTTMNRVNGIFEQEFSVRMELVPDNDDLIFLSPADPYTNSSGFSMLGENQTEVDATIGNANYDIGHVFSTGGGGIAGGIGIVCRTGQKGQGVTGLGSPIGDPFDVDYVAHEMGHQFGGQHTWNYCFGGGGASSNVAFEPGSGITIMGYAGLCGGDNIATNSIPYFHSGNLEEMIDYMTLGQGNTCPVVTSTGNTAPVISVDPDGLTIPIGTPFELMATSTDAEGDPVNYSWEEFDSGPPHVPVSSPSGDAPLFRVFEPNSTGIRVFPQMATVLGGAPVFGEQLPSYSRPMNFRVTARDNVGGVSWEDFDMTADASGGPFLVTEPAGGGVVWDSKNWYTITWDVAGTDASPFDCSTVEILLSTDGGDNFDHVLNPAAPNNGLTAIYVPELPTTEARIKVKCNENVFFNVNDQNFTIQMGSATGLNEIVGLPINIFPNPATEIVSVQLGQSADAAAFDGGNLQMTIMSAVGQQMTSQSVAYRGQFTTVQVDVSDWASGIYLVELKDETGRTATKKLLVD